MFVVAGVSGHVGSVAAEDLLAAGQAVRVIVRDEKKGEAWRQRGAEVAVGELEDAAFLTGALAGAAGFFTLLPGNFAAPDFYAAQRETAHAIVQAVRDSGVPHVVILSSVGADMAEGNGPIKGLYHLEQGLHGVGVKLTAIRAGYFQENIAQSLQPAQHMGIFPNFTPSADYPMPMIATRDIGHLVAQSLRHPPVQSEAVDLHGPAYSIRQLAEKLGAALGKALQVVDIPVEAHVSTLVQAGMSEHHAGIFAEMYAGFASGAIAPRGDRLEHGQTTIDEVIAQLVK